MCSARSSRHRDQSDDRRADTLVAVVVDSSLPYDRAIAMGVAEYARERGDWRLYVEEEQGRRVPDFPNWPGQGVIASFDDAAVADAVVASGLPVVAVGGGAAATPKRRRFPTSPRTTSASRGWRPSICSKGGWGSSASTVCHRRPRPSGPRRAAGRSSHGSPPPAVPAAP